MYEHNGLTAMAEAKRRHEQQQKSVDMGALQAQTSTGSICGSRERTIAENLAFQSDCEQENADRTRKAARILREHPEFEDFIWLIRSGLV